MSSHYMGILLAWKKDELKLLAYLKSELQKSELSKSVGEKSCVRSSSYLFFSFHGVNNLQLVV